MSQIVNRQSSIVILILILLMPWGCHKKSAPAQPVPVATAPSPEAAPTAITPPPPKPSKTAPLEPAPLPKTVVAPNNLEIGELNFHAGNYRQAAQAFEAWLSNNPKSKNRDQALFHLGLCRAIAGDSSRDLRQAEAAFKRLIAEYPDSQYKDQAEYILGLQSQIDRLRSDVRERDDRIKRLSEELQKLKEIDMQRKPSRPPE